ncbi:MAG TPA: hypothetical protein VFK37_09780, partial [Bacillales bacterium]|nr:hypothetical protein [Bacillales bacterium]
MRRMKYYGVLMLLLALCFSIVGCQSSGSQKTAKSTDSNNSAKAADKSAPLKSFSVWTWLGSVETWGGTSYEQV